MSLFETRKGRRLGLALIFFLGLLVFSPAIRAPLFLDDYLHAAMVEGTFAGKRGPFDLYDFVDDGDRAALASRGLLPWWSHPKLTIRFFRPLSSALLWLDHRVFSHGALPMHLHSVAWWAAAVLAARALFRRFFSERVAFLATACFALSPCHALPLSWVANRETLIALTFGGLALVHHFRARLSPAEGTKHAALAFVFFALALLGGGEYALAFGGYVLALEIVVRFGGAGEAGASEDRVALDRSAFAHLRALVPFAAPAAIYLAIRFRLRYGAVGSGFYSDPFRDPLAFLSTAPYRVVALLADSWLTLGSDTWLLGYERWILAAIVVATAIGVFVALRRAIVSLPAERRVVATAFALGSVFAIAPTLAVVPAFRLLGISMLGVALATALVLERAWFAPDASTDRSRLAAVGTFAALVLAFAQLVHGPMTAFLASRVHRNDGREFALRANWLAGHLGDPVSADVGIVRGLAGSFFTPFALDPRGRTPARWRVLSHAGHVLVLRPEPKTLELVVAENRTLYPLGERNLYRDLASPLKAGDVVRAAGMTVTVLEVGSLGPRRARFVFDDEPTAARWIADTFKETVDVTLPDPGEGAPFDP